VKLFHSPTSPYARKVMACAITREIDGQITLIPTNPHVSPAALLAVNPLSRVPCLVTEDGLALFDSPVICEYLDSVGETLPLFPRAGSAQRWTALKMQAAGDGIMDAAVPRRVEEAKPRDEARDLFIARQKAAVERTLDMLEAAPPGRHLDIGTISIACALGYLDFRFPHEPWRDRHPRLAAWLGAIAGVKGLAQTRPDMTAT
jgi:glutathione S-transferase